jgi:hypothetical protein
MKKLSLHSAVFSTFLVVMCAAILHDDLRAQSAAAVSPSDIDPHMGMTKLRPPQPGDQARAEAILAAAKKAAERYRDYRQAEADGYTIFMPEQRQNVYHFIRESSNLGDKERFDPNQPPALLYAKVEGPSAGYKLVGVMYMARYGATDEELNARIPLSIAQWHVHLNMCVPPQPEERNWLLGDPTFGLNGSISTAEACTAAGGYFKPHLSGWMVHVYPFETDPAKVWGAGMDDHGRHSSMSGMDMKM